MKGLSAKLTLPQLLFTAAFSATILTIVHSLTEWSNSVFEFLFAFLVFWIGVVVSRLIFKEEAAESDSTAERIFI